MTYTDEPVGARRVEASGPPPTIVPREDFWADTCREITEMQHPSQQVLELYRKYGCRFLTPGRHQVHYILDALDSAAGGWDTVHPELFYQTLELNYPELVKRG